MAKALNNYKGVRVDDMGVTQVTTELQAILADLGMKNHNDDVITSVEIFPIGEEGDLKVVQHTSSSRIGETYYLSLITKKDIAH